VLASLAPRMRAEEDDALWVPESRLRLRERLGTLLMLRCCTRG
jgi:hypothetical protein